MSTAKCAPIERLRTRARALTGLRWIPDLLLRLSVGFMFFSGAVGKLSDVDKFTAMFVGLGIPHAALAAPAVAAVELVGGGALMLGLATRLMSLLLAVDMMGALLTDIGPSLVAKYPHPAEFLSNVFYSSEWLLTVLLLSLVCAGAGRVSLDAVINNWWARYRAGVTNAVKESRAQQI